MRCPTFSSNVVQAGELYPIYLLVYYLASVLRLPLWMLLSNRIGKHRAFIVAVIWYSFWASFISFVPAGWFDVFLFIMVMKGSTFGALLALPASMAADAVDIDSARTGQQQAGLYFSVWGMLKKSGGAFSGALALAAIQLFGFDPQAEPALGRTEAGNSASSLMWLGLLYAIIPAGVKIVSLPDQWIGKAVGETGEENYCGHRVQADAEFGLVRLHVDPNRKQRYRDRCVQRRVSENGPFADGLGGHVAASLFRLRTVSRPVDRTLACLRPKRLAHERAWCASLLEGQRDDMPTGARISQR